MRDFCAQERDGLPAAARAATVPALPAAMVPVAPKVGGFVRDGYDVTHARRDVLVASGADVPLDGLVGLDASDLGLFDPVHVHLLGPDQPSRAQATKARHTTSAAATRK